MVYRYDIVLDGQLGERRGTLSWTETGGAVCGVFSLLGVDNPVRGRLEGERLELLHTLKTAVSAAPARDCAATSSPARWPPAGAAWAFTAAGPRRNRP